MKAVAVLALIAATSVAQARVTEPATIKSFEVGMAEARASVARAKNAKELAKLLVAYQNAAFRSCYVTFYVQQAGNAVMSPVRFAKNFGWGVVVGKEVIRRNYGIDGSRVESAATVAKDTVVGTFEETADNVNGEFGSCTMATEQIKLVQAGIAQMGANVDTVVKQPNGEDTPLIIVNPGSEKH